ncbi:MAG: type II toxin-antitoxin system HicB family antitoxin [Deltaproteobacteria bacterium]|nr:type II toxin-antitoxin system HicB family antitoxin [Deltaproteobacteria bacterium]
MNAHAIPSYSYRIFYDAPSGEYVAECEEIPGLSGIGATDMEALAELKEAIAGWLAALAADGMPFPLPHRGEAGTATR